MKRITGTREWAAKTVNIQTGCWKDSIRQVVGLPPYNEANEPLGFHG